MKKFLILGMMLFAFFSMAEKTYACDPGWSEATTDVIEIWSDNYPPELLCAGTVTFCYQCSPTGYDPVYITNMEVSNPCLTEYLDAKDSRVEDALLQALLSNCTFPSCTESQLQVYIQWPMCYQWHQKRWHDENNDIQYFNWKEICSGYYCQQCVNVCINYSGGGYEIISIQCVPEFETVGTACSEIEVPEPTLLGNDDTEDEVYGSCFTAKPCGE